jgi:hypothetical protein
MFLIEKEMSKRFKIASTFLKLNKNNLSFIEIQLFMNQ